MMREKRLIYLALNTLLSNEGFQGSGLRVLGVSKIQDLCSEQIETNNEHLLQYQQDTGGLGHVVHVCQL